MPEEDNSIYPTVDLMPAPINLVPTRDEAEPSQEEVLSDNIDSIVQSIVTASNDSRKIRYLGYRASGFNIKESLTLVGAIKFPYKTLDRWRADPNFKAQEDNLPELRKTLGTEFAALEFLRNMRLMLQKDYEVITKSLSGREMTKADTDYLQKTRGMYTPQQLEIMQKLVGATKDEGGIFNFKEFVLKMSRGSDSVTISGSKQS